MKKLFIIFWVCFVSCQPLSTINQEEVLKSKGETFNPFQLEIAYEVEGLRLDVKRQTFRTQSGRDITVGYHPLGFDLGNGLFYDLNQNLGLRLEYLLDIDTGENYSLKKYYSNTNQTVLSRKREDGKFCEIGENYKGFVFEECSKFIKTNDLLNFYWREKEKLLYSIEERGNTFMYFKPGQSKPEMMISKKIENEFTVGNVKKQDAFSLKNHTLYLGEKYVVRQGQEGAKIKVFRKKKNKEKLVVTIQKAEDQIFIYDAKWQGLQICLKPNKNEIEVFKNNEMWFMMKKEKE